MDKYNIVVDTREQTQLWKKNIINKKLNVGDYSIEGYEDKIAIERKSLSDLFGTLGQGHKRFKKELSKALSYQYFAIVIEGSFTDCLNKKFNGAFYSKMKGFVIIKILFTIHLKYKIPIFFTSTRTESKHLIKTLFNTYITLNKKKKEDIIINKL